MSWVTSLARDAVRAGRAYQAPTTPSLARLHANELPWPQDYDPAPGNLNFYPLLYPEALTERLAAHYGVKASEISITRGSSEGIDCLYRGFCEARQDAVLFCPPSFEMYRWYGHLQGVKADRSAAARRGRVRAGRAGPEGSLEQKREAVGVGVSPNNPTGNLMDPRPLAGAGRICPRPVAGGAGCGLRRVCGSEPRRRLDRGISARGGAANRVQGAGPGRGALRRYHCGAPKSSI